MCKAEEFCFKLKEIHWKLLNSCLLEVYLIPDSFSRAEVTDPERFENPVYFSKILSVLVFSIARADRQISEG